MKEPLYLSFKHAFEGIFTALKDERNMKIHVSVMILVIIAGLYFHITRTEWLVCLIFFGLVISMEIMNTALESAVDFTSAEEHPIAKKAKDCAAGAVLVSAISSAVAGLIIFVPYIVA